jgi:glycosyltransferase involved in cell wall biosynthesis
MDKNLIPKISVAIPTYINTKEELLFLKESFERIHNQTFKDYEVVISDNSNNEFVEKLCLEYQDRFSIIYKKELESVGMSANSNAVINLCNGEYIKILHCDDFLFSDKALEIIVNSLDNSDKYWLVNQFNHTYDSINFFDPRSPNYPNHLLIGNNLLGSPTNVTIRNFNIEYFDTNVNLSMDIEWYHRLRMKYGMPLIVNDVLTTSRQHKSNTTSKLNFDIVVEGDGCSWQFIQSELEYLQEKHKDFFENWEYPNG